MLFLVAKSFCPSAGDVLFESLIEGRAASIQISNENHSIIIFGLHNYGIPESELEGLSLRVSSEVSDAKKTP